MIEVTVNIVRKGKNYLTNVIAKKDTPEEQILSIAQKQIEKQWIN